MDRDGIPHYMGAQPSLMKEYWRQVLFAYRTLDGSGDDKVKEARSKNQARFAKRLINGLHGEAWRPPELVMDHEKLKAPDGLQAHLCRLAGHREGRGDRRKTGAFNQYFERCFRRRGQSVGQFLCKRRRDWSNLEDVTDSVQVSEDLQAYFLLKHLNLTKKITARFCWPTTRATRLRGSRRRSGCQLEGPKGARDSAGITSNKSDEGEEAVLGEYEDEPNEQYALTAECDEEVAELVAESKRKPELVARHVGGRERSSS